MFEAVIVICLGVVCTELTDTRGPYLRKEDCEARLDEMVEQINDLLIENGNYSPKSMAGYCIKDHPDETAISTGPADAHTTI